MMQEIILSRSAVNEVDLVGQGKRSLPLPVIQPEVRDHGVKPRGEFGLFALVPQIRSFPKFEKRPLDNIFGVIAMLDDPIRHAEKPFGVPMDQRREGLMIPLLYPTKQRVIVRL
jgi:hypothetical protein